MPIRLIEDLQSRRHEKVMNFLTIENIVALVVTFFPLFVLTGGMPIVVRAPICLLGALAGYVLTLDYHGLPLYEHGLWVARGALRLRAQGDRIAPEDLPGAIPQQEREDRPLAVDGPIQAVRRERQRPASAAPAPVGAGPPEEAADADL